MLPRGEKILCAVSGGADSVCLLHLLREKSESFGFGLIAAHFNHRLRGAESDRDEEFVKKLCADLNIEIVIGSGDVREYARKMHLGIEESARELRYAFLEETAEKSGASRIATAHNANDNVETVLLNLARGGGTRGLSGMPPVRGKIVRPLLQTTRAEIEAYLEKRGLSHIEDSTNALDEYARNRVRHRIAPELEGLNPGYVRNISRACQSLREDDEFLDSLAQKFLDENKTKNGISAPALHELPKPVSARVLQKLGGGRFSQKHITALRGLCTPGMSGKSLDLPGMRIVREFDSLIFFPEKTGKIETMTVFPGMKENIGESLSLKCEYIEKCREVNSSLNTFYFKYADICDRIIVRPRKPGDRIRLKGRGCTKELKKLFAESELPASSRDSIPVIADAQGPIAVYGFGVSERCAAEPGADVLKITIREK